MDMKVIKNKLIWSLQLLLYKNEKLEYMNQFK
jgi:hypothetical protein